MGHAERAAAQGAAPWPDDEALLALMAEWRTFKAVAACCGKRRESLRDYLIIRPELNAAMRALLLPYMTPAQVDDAKRKYSTEWLKRNQEYRRAARRQWMRGKRADPQSLDYEQILRGDPCSYCGGTVATTDHIVPRRDGGEDHWSNYTGACRRCNDSKGARSLLAFLLRRNDGCSRQVA